MSPPRSTARSVWLDDEWLPALALCDNYTPSPEALAACYHAMGEDKPFDLKAAYGVDDEQTQEGTA